MSTTIALTPTALADLESGVADARRALDDLWWLAATLAKEGAESGTTPADVHEAVFKVAASLRGVQLDLARLRPASEERENAAAPAPRLVLVK